MSDHLDQARKWARIADDVTADRPAADIAALVASSSSTAIAHGVIAMAEELSKATRALEQIAADVRLIRTGRR